MFKTLKEAKNVLDEMSKIIQKYGFVCGCDYLDLSGVSSGTYIDFYYGWTDIKDAKIKQIENGYVILMPESKIIKSKIERRLKDKIDVDYVIP